MNGTIPDIFDSLPNLIALDLSSNRFSGKIPDQSITRLKNLDHL